MSDTIPIDVLACGIQAILREVRKEHPCSRKMYPVNQTTHDAYSTPYPEVGGAKKSLNRRDRSFLATH